MKQWQQERTIMRAILFKLISKHLTGLEKEMLAMQTISAIQQPNSYQRIEEMRSVDSKWGNAISYKVQQYGVE